MSGCSASKSLGFSQNLFLLYCKVKQITKTDRNYSTDKIGSSPPMPSVAGLLKIVYQDFEKILSV